MFVSNDKIENEELQKSVRTRFPILRENNYYILRQTMRCIYGTDQTRGEYRVPKAGILLKYAGAEYTNDSKYLVFKEIAYNNDDAELVETETIYVKFSEFFDNMIEETNPIIDTEFNAFRNDVEKLDDQIETNCAKYNCMLYIAMCVIVALACIIGGFFIIPDNPEPNKFDAPTYIMLGVMLTGVVVLINYVLFINEEYIIGDLIPDFFNNKLKIDRKTMQDKAKKNYIHYSNIYNFDAVYYESDS